MDACVCDCVYIFYNIYYFFVRLIVCFLSVFKVMMLRAMSEAYFRKLK